MLAITACAALGVLLALELFAAAQFARRRALERSAPPDLGEAPRVVLVVPCKGLERGLREGLESYATQSHPRYRLVLATATADDPAVPAIREVARRHRHVEHLVAGEDERYGPKIYNVLRGIESAPGSDVYAFGDSDIGPDPGWLGRLVRPLGDARIGATTGYRWYWNGQPGLWDRVTSLWNGFVLFYMALPPLRFVWGGSYALRREVLEEVDLRRTWRQVVNDDLTLTSALRRNGYQIAFVPSCVSFSAGSFTFAGMIEWTTRQLIQTRFYFGRVFYGSLGVMVGSAALAVLAPWTFLAMASIFGIGTVGMAHATLPARDPRKPRWVDAGLFALCEVPLAIAVVIAIFKSTLTWRGAVYRIHSATHMTVERGGSAPALADPIE